MSNFRRACGQAGMCLLLVSCESRSSAPTAPPSASAAHAVPSAQPPDHAPSARAPRPVPSAACRAIQVSGRVTTAAGRALSRGDALEGAEWLKLGDGAHLVVRHASSSREYALEGPGQVLPCRAGHEEVLMISGALRAAPGGGARPGAFVTIATPLGSIRYGNADVSVQAKSRRVDVEGISGSVWVDPAKPARLVGKPKLTGPKAKSGLILDRAPDPQRLVASCEKAANDSEDKAKSLLGGSATGGLGSGAAAHMVLRSAARRTCLVAEAALGLANQPELTALTQRLEQANQRWQRVPLLPGKAPPHREQK